jgi:hypothetical protein
MSSNYPSGLEPSVCPWTDSRDIDEDDWNQAVEELQDDIIAMFDCPKKPDEEAATLYRRIYERITARASEIADERENREAEAAAYDRWLDAER